MLHALALVDTALTRLPSVCHSTHFSFLVFICSKIILFLLRLLFPTNNSIYRTKSQRLRTHYLMPTGSTVLQAFLDTGRTRCVNLYYS